MAITRFQKDICRLVAKNRKHRGVSYVAGGVALNQLIDNPRLSRDIDVFTDVAAAVYDAWDSDGVLLQANGYVVSTLRQLPTFIEAEVTKGTNTVLMQWAQDSAFRFFPLLEDETFGLVLHPFDLATNKVLALAGRLEVRDWVDLINCHDKLQHAGYLFWAACGKDPGFGPASLLAEAKRSSHYSAVEIGQLAFDGPAPDASALGKAWRGVLKESAEILDLLPADEVGKCVLDEHANLFRGDPSSLEDAMKSKSLRFHQGTMHGAFPRLV